LRIEKREIGTKGRLTDLRNKGYLPGILYGAKKESIPFYVEKRKLFFFIHRKMPIFDIMINGKREHVLIKEKQVDPIKNQIIHIDLMRVSLKEKIEVNVEITPVGVPRGVEEGGVFEQHIYQLGIKCFPSNIPEKLEVDVGNLKIGDMFFISNLPEYEGIEIFEDKDKLLFSIIAPRIKKEEEVTVEEESIEPEVIKRGKKEKELEE